MAKQLRFQIHNARPGGQYALMAFDLAVGYDTGDGFVGLLDVRGLFLKQKKDGTKNYVTFPSKPRIDRDTQEIKVDDNGYKIYDNHVDLYMEKGTGPGEEAWRFRDWLINEATTLAESMDQTEGGRGPARAAAAPARGAAPPRSKGAKAAKPARAEKPVAAATVTEDEFEDDEDSLPF